MGHRVNLDSSVGAPVSFEARRQDAAKIEESRNGMYCAPLLMTEMLQDTDARIKRIFLQSLLRLAHE
jgi:hypothetical protein